MKKMYNAPALFVTELKMTDIISASRMTVQTKRVSHDDEEIEEYTISEEFWK